MNEYIGALHIHSIFSDGSGKVDEIMQAASEVGLDFIILTDHNTLRALKDGFEGWYKNTLLLVGCEINDKENKNHLLAFNIDETISTRTPAKDYVRMVRERGGISFLAHPHEKRNHLAEHPPYPWIEWDTTDFTGIEIWNHMSEWMEYLTEENKYQSFLHPLKTIVAPPPETLKVWDELSLSRRVVGIGGIDAHAHKYNLLGFVEVQVFPYKVLFKSIRTHILTNEKIDNKTDKAIAKNILYESLKNGLCFVANDYHADSRGFKFYAKSDSKIFQMGETIESDGNIKLVVEIPKLEAEIRIIHNGQFVISESAVTKEFDVSKKGVYRVEIFHQNKAWIYSNHIRIV